MNQNSYLRLTDDDGQTTFSITINSPPGSYSYLNAKLATTPNTEVRMYIYVPYGAPPLSVPLALFSEPISETTDVSSLIIMEDRDGDGILDLFDAVDNNNITVSEYPGADQTLAPDLLNQARPTTTLEAAATMETLEESAPTLGALAISGLLEGTAGQIVMLTVESFDASRDNRIPDTKVQLDILPTSSAQFLDGTHTKILTTGADG